MSNVQLKPVQQKQNIYQPRIYLSKLDNFSQQRFELYWGKGRFSQQFVGIKKNDWKLRVRIPGHKKRKTKKEMQFVRRHISSAREIRWLTKSFAKQIIATSTAAKAGTRLSGFSLWKSSVQECLRNIKQITKRMSSPGTSVYKSWTIKYAKYERQRLPFKHSLLTVPASIPQTQTLFEKVKGKRCKLCTFFFFFFKHWLITTSKTSHRLWYCFIFFKKKDAENKI